MTRYHLPPPRGLRSRDTPRRRLAQTAASRATEHRLYAEGTLAGPGSGLKLPAVYIQKLPVGLKLPVVCI